MTQNVLLYHPSREWCSGAPDAFVGNCRKGCGLQPRRRGPGCLPIWWFSHLPIAAGWPKCWLWIGHRTGANFSACGLGAQTSGLGYFPGAAALAKSQRWLSASWTETPKADQPTAAFWRVGRGLPLVPYSPDNLFLKINIDHKRKDTFWHRATWGCLLFFKKKDFTINDYWSKTSIWHHCAEHGHFVSLNS